MSFPRYPSYKPSGVEWLGEVPAHWSVTKTKRIVRFTTGWTPPTGNSEAFVGDNLWANISDLGSKVIDDTAKRISDEAIADSRIKPSPKGSLLFSFKLSIGQVSFAGRDMFTNEAIATFHPSADLNLDFAYFAFPTYLVQNAVENIYGARMLNQELIRSASFPLPTFPEQTRIAEFLDRETAKIDELVAEQRQLMELLKEKRQAVISHAVTRGLNPKALLKPSGIEWLGDVPTHWEIKPLKYSITKIEQGWSPQCDNEPASENEWGVLKVGCVNRDKFDPDEQKALPLNLPPETKYEIEPGDILMSRGNTLELVGMSSFVEQVRPRLLLSDLLYRFRGRQDRAESEFLVLALRSPNVRFQIEREATGTSASMKKIGQGVIREFVIGLPPLDEQRAIVTFIKTEIANLDTLTAEAQRAIDLLQERRTALISAAVTGQIDVRHVAAPAETLLHAAEAPTPYGQ